MRSSEWRQYLSNDPRLDADRGAPGRGRSRGGNQLRATVLLKGLTAAGLAARRGLARRARRPAARAGSACPARPPRRRAPASRPSARRARGRSPGRGRSRPPRWRVRPRWKRSKICSRSAGCTPGPRSTTSTCGAVGVAADGHADRLARRAVAQRVVEQDPHHAGDRRPGRRGPSTARGGGTTSSVDVALVGAQARTRPRPRARARRARRPPSAAAPTRRAG